jgi:thymidylate kinase
VKRDRGLSVAVVGIDGVGKTTLVAGVRALEPTILVVKVGIHRSGSAARTRLGWLRNTMHGARVLLRARQAIRRGDIVLWDRHPIEDRLLGLYGRRVMGRRRGWLVRLAPPIDVLVVLDAPVEHVIAHRPDEVVGRLASMRATYLHMASTMPSVIVDARQGRDAVRDQVLEVLRHRQAAS